MVNHIIRKIKIMNVDYVSRDNISDDCLGVKGLHLNSKGTCRESDISNAGYLAFRCSSSLCSSVHST